MGCISSMAMPAAGPVSLAGVDLNKSGNKKIDEFPFYNDRLEEQDYNYII